MATPNSHNEWQTPSDLFRVLNAEFHFDLDAAASDQNFLISNYITQHQDALVTPWSGRVVWCNPPYGRGNEPGSSLLTQFIKRGYEQHLEQKNTVVMLIPTYSDPKYWTEWVCKAHEIRDLAGRLQFLENGVKKTSARFPSSVVVFKYIKGIHYGKSPNRWSWDWRK